MEYNTQQRKLPLPEYGRSVQNMVDHALTIEDREERQRCANTIVNIMGGMFPQLRDMEDFVISCGIIWPLCPTSNWILTIRWKL